TLVRQSTLAGAPCRRTYPCPYSHQYTRGSVSCQPTPGYLVSYPYRSKDSVLIPTEQALFALVVVAIVKFVVQFNFVRCQGLTQGCVGQLQGAYPLLQSDDLCLVLFQFSHLSFLSGVVLLHNIQNPVQSISIS